MAQKEKINCCNSPDKDYHNLGETSKGSGIYVYTFKWEGEWHIESGRSFMLAIEEFAKRWYQVPDGFKVVPR